MPDIKIAVTSFNTPTSTGNINVTTPDLGGRTPKAVLLLATNHLSSNDPSSTSRGEYALGIFDGTNKFNVTTTIWNTTGSQTGVARYMNNTHLLYISVPSSGTLLVGYAVADPVAFIANGVTLNFIAATSPSARVIAIFFAGDDLQVHAGAMNLGTTTTKQDNTAVGFEPDAVLCLTDLAALSTSGTAFFNMCVGMALKDGTQRSVMQTELNNLSTDAPYAYTSKNYVSTQLDSGALTYGVALSDFDSQGFSFQCSASAGNDQLPYLALAFGGLTCALVDLATPATTGDVDYNPGFEPGFYLAALTTRTAYDSVASNPSATNNSVMLGAGSPGSAGCISMRASAGSAPPVSASVTRNDKSIAFGATTLFDNLATLTGMDTNGVHMNYSAADGTVRRGFMFMLETATPGGLVPYNSGSRRSTIVM